MTSLILITVDSLRRDFLHCYGSPLKSSPNIDKLAQEGTVFENAISAGPYTRVSFPPLLTERCALSIPLSSSGGVDIRDIRPYLPEVLHQHGYETAAFHSYNPFISSLWGYNRGFDVFKDFIPYVNVTAKKRRTLAIDSLPFEGQLRMIKDGFNALRHRYGENANYDFRSLENAVSWIKQRRGEIFCWLHLMSTHMPYSYGPFNLGIKERLEAVLVNRKLISSSRWRSDFRNKDIEKLKKLYVYSVQLIDYLIGKLLSTIEEEVGRENVVVIITADHGEEFREHRGMGHGCKLYDELIHVPLIIWGSNINKKKVSQVTSLSQIPALVLHYLGIYGKIFCRNPLTVHINGKKGVISEYRASARGFGYSIRTDTHKLILNIGDQGVSKELYNLEEDSNETRNVFCKYPNLTEDLRDELKKHISWETQQRRLSLAHKRVQEVK